MFEKYPSISPYTYCANNPVCVIDPDGRDGIGIVNKKNRTITITATYFVQSIPYPNQSTTAYTKEEIANMQAETNKTLNEAGYTVSSGRYEGYSVVFNLQFKEGGDAPNTEDKASKEFFENYSVGNSFQKGNLKTHPNIFSSKSNGDVTGGVTQDNKKILMNEKYDTKRNQIHEIFHTLFFNQDNAPNGIGSYTNQDLPNQNDIDILINNPDLIKIIESEE